MLCVLCYVLCVSVLKFCVMYIGGNELNMEDKKISNLISHVVMRFMYNLSRSDYLINIRHMAI